MLLFEGVLRALNDAGVDYIIVGGVATVLHGHARFTADIDLTIAFDPVNVQKAIRCLVDEGYTPTIPADPYKFADSAVRQMWREEKGMVVFSFKSQANPLVAVDVFTNHPIPYDILSQGVVEVDAMGLRLPICSLDHLLEMKRAAGRPKDLEDVRILEMIREKRRRDAED